MNYRDVFLRKHRQEAVNHSAQEYVRGDVHINSVENVWSLLKRSIIGAHHHLSVKHLPAYLTEQEFRFNNRNNKSLLLATMHKLITAESLPYKKPVNGEV